MTVADLIALLQKHDPATLLVARGPDGNLSPNVYVQLVQNWPYWLTEDALEILAD